jgi:signal peptidase II
MDNKIHGVKNFSLALSLNFSSSWLLIVFYFLVAVLIFLLVHFLILAIKNNNYWRLTALSLLLAGAASNLIDRVKFGFVIDYLNFYFFYNNLADLALWGGLFCWLWPRRQK